MVVHCFSGKPGWTVSLQQVSSSTASFMQLQCPPRAFNGMESFKKRLDGSWGPGCPQSLDAILNNQSTSASPWSMLRFPSGQVSGWRTCKSVIRTHLYVRSFLGCWHERKFLWLSWVSYFQPCCECLHWSSQSNLLIIMQGYIL